MSIPVQNLIEAQQHNQNLAVTSLEWFVLHLLKERFQDTALTRDEIGKIFTKGEDNGNEFAVLVGQMLSPAIRKAVKDSSSILDAAITNLVRSGVAHMTLVDRQAFFSVSGEASDRSR